MGVNITYSCTRLKTTPYVAVQYLRAPLPRRRRLDNDERLSPGWEWACSEQEPDCDAFYDINAHALHPLIFYSVYREPRHFSDALLPNMNKWIHPGKRKREGDECVIVEEELRKHVEMSRWSRSERARHNKKRRTTWAKENSDRCIIQRFANGRNFELNRKRGEVGCLDKELHIREKEFINFKLKTFSSSHISGVPKRL